MFQEDSDGDSSPHLDKNCGLKGIPWKDFSKEEFNRKEELSSKMYGKNVTRKQAEKSDRVRKNKKVPKKRDINGEFDDDEDDDEIRYLQKLRTSKVAAGYKDAAEDSGIKKRSLSLVLKVRNNENAKDFGPSRPNRDSKKAITERVREDTDYEPEEELMSEGEPEGKKEKLGKDITDFPTEHKKEIALTTRQRALLSSRDFSSAAGANEIEFPNGLPPPPPRSMFYGICFLFVFLQIFCLFISLL